MTQKVFDWQARFWSALREAQGKPFKWGENDCVLYATRILDAITGEHFYDAIRERFPCHSALDAMRMLPNGLQPLIEEYLGPAVHPSRCTMGDLVLCLCDGRESLCMHDGVQLLGVNADGVVRVAYASAVVGWRIV